VTPREPHQSLVTLDVEGVLTPEVWIATAESTGLEELKRTTRDEPDYDVLMKDRLAALDRAGVTMSQIMGVVHDLRPLDGAAEFLEELRSKVPVVLLSDTFEQFGWPLMAHLGFPTLLCHRLVVEDDRIVDYQIRLPDQKCYAVRGFRQMNYRVVAAGDSYNDTTMLGAADVGILFEAPPGVVAEFPEFEAVEGYEALLAALLDAAA